jgi:hypothetical protein
MGGAAARSRSAFSVSSSAACAPAEHTPRLVPVESRCTALVIGAYSAGASCAERVRCQGAASLPTRQFVRLASVSPQHQRQTRPHSRHLGA